MSISMLITNRRTGQSEEIPVCTNPTYHAYWDRAAMEEGLEMIQALPALWITPQFRDRFLVELAQLKAWAAARATTDEYLPEMVQRIDRIVEVVSSHPLDGYEISFG